MPSDRRLQASWGLRAGVIACLVGGEIIHTAAMAPHWAAWTWSGLFFLALSIAEGLMAVGLLLAPSRPLYALTLAASLATVGLWAVSRSIGLWFGPQAWQPEVIGRADLTATALETIRACLLIVLLADPLLRTAPAATAAPGRGARRVLAACLVVSVGPLSVWAAAGASQHAHNLAVRTGAPGQVFTGSGTDVPVLGATPS